MPTLKRKFDRGRITARLSKGCKRNPAAGEIEADPWPEDPWLEAEKSHALSGDCWDPWEVPDALVPATLPAAEADPWELLQGSSSTTPKRPVVQLAGLVQAAAGTSLTKKPGSAKNVYEASGSKPERVSRVLQQHCPRGCQLPGCQAKGLELRQALEFVKNFWDLPAVERGHCMRLAYYSGPHSDDRAVATEKKLAPTRSSWLVHDVPVCFQRFCGLLGCSQRTIRRMIAGCLDFRKSVQGGLRPKPAEQLMKCNTFFTELHQSAAVPDPEDTSCAVSQLSSGPTGSSGLSDMVVNPWEDWSYDWAGAAPVTVACQAKVLGLPRRFISHCRLIDLYWQMAAEWSVLQEVRPDVGAMPSFRTFHRCYQQLWQKLLVIRRESQHSKCQVCFDLQLQMQKPNLPWSVRTEAAQRLRQHHRDQYHDRLLYWSLRWSSRQVNPEVLCVIIDSMGKWGNAWPKFHHDKTPHELERICRPTMILTGSLAHGWCTGLYLSLEPLGHGSATHLH